MTPLAHLTALLIPSADEPSPAPSAVINPPELSGTPADAAWWSDLLTGPVLRTAIIVVGAVVLRFVLYKLVDGFVRGLTVAAGDDLPSPPMDGEAREVIGEDQLHALRRVNRASTLGQLLKNVGSVVIISLALLMILAEWGFNMGPLIAGAGVLGLAFGFGAQTLVSDFLSGVFMLLEDQYGVGDIIDIDGTSGTVEDVQLRVTRLRSVDGVVWWVRNGEVTKVGNMSQNWSRTVLDVGVAYSANIPEVRRLMTEEAHALHADPQWGPLLLELPEVWGVESLGNDAVVVRAVLKTVPGEQWRVARELRERIKNRFDAEGVEIPFPQRTVWLRQDSAGSPEKAGQPST
jgi:small-conductance mechanosensitive channel